MWDAAVLYPLMIVTHPLVAAPRKPVAETAPVAVVIPAWNEEGSIGRVIDDLPAGPILAGEADFVLGSRMLKPQPAGALLPQAIFGNKLACLLMRQLLGARYTDLGPFRAIAWEKLRQLEMCDANFGWTVEMQIK